MKLALAQVGVLTAAFGLMACSPAPKSSVTNQGNNSIISGAIVDANDPIAKVTVLIVYATQDKAGLVQQMGCTGSILSKNVILTAAHCIPVTPPGGKRMAQIVFSTDIKKASKENVRRVVEFAIHPEYKKTKKEESNADFGMMKFEGEMPAGYEVATYLSPDDHQLIDMKSRIVVAGYGLQDDKTKLSSDELRRGEVGVGGMWGKSELILDQRNRNGVCSGDSGGPSFLQVNGEYHVLGVASRVSGDTEETVCSMAGIVGLVAMQREFIDGTLKQWEAADTQAVAQ